ncbi:MAG: DEAD/DEAH box helicase family protein [Gemmataceae bacterium]
MSAEPIELSFDRGTVLLRGGPDGYPFTTLPGVRFDERTNGHRAQGRYYRSIVERLIRDKTPYTDLARGWPKENSGWILRDARNPYPHQKEALASWVAAGRRGMVILPTGTGKTFVAVLCIANTQRPTLVVTPTIDLMNQWYAELTDLLGTEIGLLGGGYYDFKPITVTTYDSAYIHLERWGHKFALLVFDEVHHLPGATYSEAAIGSLAPFRLGLTATPERQDGADVVLPELIGPIVYRREIQQLSGLYLSEYRTQRVYVELSPEEMEHYTACREEYRRYLASSGIQLGGPNGWQRFLFEASRTPQGIAALKAYREQKTIERTASGKFTALERLLAQHGGERIIIFTADNATVYHIARQYLIPAITHQTKIKERKEVLQRFHRGEYGIVVTSQVLNEGVDVPAAGVGIVLSGTGSTRENVQRLGRLLRKFEGKQAILYEVVAKGTAEEFTSDRRRQHGAFQ